MNRNVKRRDVSIHMMLAAAYLPREVINQTQKAVLMKIADSADDQTRLARPGLERMMAWAGVGEKTTINVVTELVGDGWVERVSAGRVGRRAEYRVFPYGVPPIPTTEELIERRHAAQRAPKNPRLARQTKRRKPSPPALTQQDVAARRARPAAEARAGLPEGNPVSEGGGFPTGNPAGSRRETERVPPGKPLLFLVIPQSFLLPYPHGWRRRGARHG